VRLLAIFGPTAVGKTAVAIAVADRLRERGEDPVAVSCDAFQIYSGLEILSGAPTAGERERLEHRLVGRRPIVVGGTGLYLRAALSDLDLRPPLPTEVREEVERELAAQGSPAVHARLTPDVAAGVHPNDAKRVARLAGLERMGIDPPSGSDGLWSRSPRVATTLVGLTLEREELRERVGARAQAILAAGAQAEVRAAEAAGASRTARKALGFEALLEGDAESLAGAHRAFARRQLTWMRRMEGVELIDRAGRSDNAVAQEIVGLLDENEAG